MASRSTAPDPLDIDAQERNAAAKAARDELKARQEVEDLKWLMAHQSGRRYVAKLLEITGIYRSSFTGNSETFFREGQRNVGLRIVGEIHEHCPDAYVKMLKEYRANE